MAAPHDPESLLAHFDWVRSLARTLARDASRADDLTQDAMVAAMQHPPREGVPVKRWLAAVVRNLRRQGIRSDLRRAEREGRAARQERLPSTADLVERTMFQKEIVSAVLRLDEPYRRTVLLRYLDGRTPREIAAMDGVPVATVQTRLERALARLRQGFDKQYGERSSWLFLASALAVKHELWTAAAAGVVIVKAKTMAVTALAALAVISVLWWQPFGGGETPSTSAAGGTVARATGERAEAERGIPEAPGTRAEVKAPVKLDGAATGSAGVAPETKPGAAVARILRGRVIDCESHAIRGIDIRFREIDGKHPAPDAGAGAVDGNSSIATTGDDGTFQISAPKETRRLEVDSDHYLTVLDGFSVETAEQPETVIVVAPRISLSGVVVNAKGDPVAGAGVVLSPPADFRARFREVLDASTNRSWSVKSDDRGRFDLGQVPQIPGATVDAGAIGYLPAAIPAPTGSNFQLTIVLTRQERHAQSLAGHVVDAERQPVAGARVGNGNDKTTTSDKDGRFLLDLAPNGPVKLGVAKLGFAAVAEYVKPVLIDGAAAWPEDTRIVLNDPAMRITGKVVNSDGKPIANSSVWIDNSTFLGRTEDQMYIAESVAGTWPGDSMDMESGESDEDSVNAGSFTAPIVKTGKDGKFLLRGLSRKAYQIRAMDPSTLAVASAEIAAGTENAEVRVFSNDLFERVAGVVNDRRGNPLEGVDVMILRTGFSMSVNNSWNFSSGGGSLGPVKTGPDGRFEFKRVAKAKVHVSADSTKIMPDGVDLTPSSNPENVVITVSARCHFKIELSEPDEADGFEILDDKGRRLSIHVFSGGDTWASDREKLTGGKSPMVAIDEMARTLVLRLGKEEVRRIPLDLKPGEPNVIRP